MKIGLIDCEAVANNKKRYPNLSIMKISAYHKRIGDSVEWYYPLLSGEVDKEIGRAHV